MEKLAIKQLFQLQIHQLFCHKISLLITNLTLTQQSCSFHFRHSFYAITNFMINNVTRNHSTKGLQAIRGLKMATTNLCQLFLSILLLGV